MDPAGPEADEKLFLLVAEVMRCTSSPSLKRELGIVKGSRDNFAGKVFFKNLLKNFSKLFSKNFFSIPHGALFDAKDHPAGSKAEEHARGGWLSQV